MMNEPAAKFCGAASAGRAGPRHRRRIAPAKSSRRVVVAANPERRVRSGLEAQAPVVILGTGPPAPHAVKRRRFAPCFPAEKGHNRAEGLNESMGLRAKVTS